MRKRRPSSGDSPAPSLGLPSRGDSIEVYWEGDDAYYQGVVDTFKPETGTFRINYIDGDVEDLNLENEIWRYHKPPSLNGVPAPTVAASAVATVPQGKPPAVNSTPTSVPPVAEKQAPADNTMPVKTPKNVYTPEPSGPKAPKRARSPSPSRETNNNTSGIVTETPIVISPSEAVKRNPRSHPKPNTNAGQEQNKIPKTNMNTNGSRFKPSAPRTTVGMMSALATEAARTVCSTALKPVKADVEGTKTKIVECLNANKKIVDHIEKMAVKQEEIADENKNCKLELAKSEAEKSRSVEKYVKSYLDEYFQGHQRETSRLSNRIAQMEKHFVNRGSNGSVNIGSASSGFMHSEAQKIRQLVQLEINKKSNKNNAAGCTDIEARVKKSIMPGVEKILVHFLRTETVAPGDTQKNPRIDTTNRTPQVLQKRPLPGANRPSNAVGNTSNAVTGGNSGRTQDAVMKDVVEVPSSRAPAATTAPPTVEDMRRLVARRATEFLLDDYDRPKPPRKSAHLGDWTKECALLCLRHIAESIKDLNSLEDTTAAIQAAKGSNRALELEWFTNPGIEAHVLKARLNYDSCWSPKLTNEEWLAEAAVLREVGTRFRTAELIRRTETNSNHSAIDVVSKATETAMGHFK